ncbi:anti-sigma F factor [Fodinisporobacter ferrooxydans]|uniref:Anti-sigma F factor n=1 Tax=Fodinisporobacter ferrooxydans TaxID=2901836 RepID=A0ABY4CHQ4_9BACL|nr:anti-sigma F factor [Alicyclobacillaceae bacterium MYW30-H2]
MSQHNFMTLQFASKSPNESFARVAVAAFLAQMDPTLDELTEIKTVVSEAVTNAIIHGYENQEGVITISCSFEHSLVTIEVRDEGRGISDVETARQPLYTSKPELERSGMGFTIMESFMDSLEVESAEGKGTVIRLTKLLKTASVEH